MRTRTAHRVIDLMAALKVSLARTRPLETAMYAAALAEDMRCYEVVSHGDPGEEDPDWYAEPKRRWVSEPRADEVP